MQSIVAPNVRPIWTPDEAVSRCQQCDQAFSTFKRRHHCRSCGLVFCDRCTSKKLELPKLGYDRPVRICPPCYRRVTSRNAQSEPSRLMSERTSVYSDPQITESPSKDPAPSSPRNEEPSSPRTGDTSRAHTISSPAVLLSGSNSNSATGSPYKPMGYFFFYLFLFSFILPFVARLIFRALLW
eukprot:TRINITY_DN3769_c0_g1_i1.p1 TRINITY_DN3769_c0_g1~~TRINITY_DN3769_c0_g1_i1.p1  ORF type:complete len:183 (-),score=12.42 TRINITY_DN3769_c0_g1_i1:39-587(-)